MLKKVILLEHYPRFDCDTKTMLAQLANKTLSDLITASKLKENICIGKHTMNSYGIGKTHERRYRDPKTGMYDGIHYFGPGGESDLTNNLTRVFSCAKLGNLVKLNSADNQLKSVSPSVPIQNRFNPISQGN